MKKNFNKIPVFMQAKLDNISSNNIVVAAVKKYTATEIGTGALKNLGVISVKDLETGTPPTTLPLENAGRYSKANIHGKVITRKDLPKEMKTIDCGSRPIFGDYNKGSFTLYVTRLVYPKEYLPAKRVNIMIQLIKVDEENDEMNYIFKIVVGKPLVRTSSTFEEDLLFNINLLQENVGSVNIFSSIASEEEYLNTISLDWEILPIGSSDQIFNKLSSKYKNISPEMEITIRERYDFLIGLKPQKFIFCDSGLKRYFGAMFSEKLVVFENMRKMNAIYIMFEEWEALSKLTRRELIENYQGKFIRIKHHEGTWKEKVVKQINLRMGRND